MAWYPLSKTKAWSASTVMCASGLRQDMHPTLAMQMAFCWRYSLLIGFHSRCRVLDPFFFLSSAPSLGFES